MASVGRRDRVASDAEEKTLMPRASCVSRPRIVFGSSDPVGAAADRAPGVFGVVAASSVIRPHPF